MRASRLLPALLVSAAVAAATLTHAQAPPAAETLVKATAAPLALVAGTTGEVVVTLTIEPTWHVNANPPALDYNIPTTVGIKSGAGLSVRRPKYPPPHKQKFSFDDSELFVWDGQVDVRVPLAAAASAPNGVQRLKGEVEFQACNDQVCLAPTTVPFTVDVTITGGAAPGTAVAVADTAAAPDTTRAPPPANDGANAPGTGFATAPPQGASTTSVPPALDNPIARTLTGGGWAAFLLLFGIGLSLNLTPCVYPMLGVTVSIFGARSKAPPLQVFGLAAVYVLGMCLMYSTLGVIAALSGGLFGAFLQNPIVLVGIGLLLLALALSMFGLYEFQAPTWLMDKVGGNHTSSVLGIFLSGLVVGVFAAPCVGPPIVAVLAVIGAKADPVYGFLSLFVLALGLGFPYLLLGTFSNLLQSMPRSGEWMVWVKKLFGVIMASVGLTYLMLGFAPRFSPWVLPAGLLLGGLYLGFMEKSGNALRNFALLKRLGGIAAVLLGVGLTVQLARAPAAGLAFEAYSDAKLQAALASGRPAMLDFSADWCVPCHELELQTFTDRRVIAEARAFKTFKVDLTSYKSADSEAWRKRFGIAGVPTVVFLRPDGSEIREARVEGFVPPATFLRQMAMAR